MAEEKKDNEKKSGSSSSSAKSSSGSSGGAGGGPLKKFGCGCLLLVLLFASFLLGTLYGRKVFPYLFDQAHESIDYVSDHAHEGLEKADKQIKEKSH